jgi:hypothetical protein
MRDRRLQGIEAIVERQERVTAEGDEDRLLLDRVRPFLSTLYALPRSVTAPRQTTLSTGLTKSSVRIAMRGIYF